MEIADRRARLLPAGRYVKITIADRGTGHSQDETAPENFRSLFHHQAGRRADLGLAISYSIIKKHGGLLHLEKSSPDGSTFAFYLPASEGKTQYGGPEGEWPCHINSNHQRVLVMDDEAAIRELTCAVLGTLGYEVTAVPDGLEAIRTYERALRRGEQFQAVILDATVRGGLGGVATIERLRGMDPQVNAIICSGYSDEAALSEFLNYGFRGALPKPFTAERARRGLETHPRAPSANPPEQRAETAYPLRRFSSWARNADGPPGI